MRILLIGATGQLGSDLIRHVKTLIKRMAIEALYRPSAHDEAGAGPQDLSVCCAGWRSRGRTTM